MIKPEIFYDFIRNFYVIEYYKRDPLVSIGEIKRDIFIFYNYLIEYDEHVIIPLNMIKNEFPGLYGT